jgi:hypothetical protein
VQCKQNANGVFEAQTKLKHFNKEKNTKIIITEGASLNSNSIHSTCFVFSESKLSFFF